MTTYRNELPQLGEEIFLSDGGLETTLIFHNGIDLPHFASFAKPAPQRNQGITASSEDKSSRTVLDREFEEVNKVMTEAVVGSPPRCYPMGAAGRCR